MNELLERARAYWKGRSARERWLVVLGACIVAFFAVQSMIVGRIEASAQRAEAEASQLESDRTRAVRLAADVRGIQGALAAVESRIQPGAKTNLLAMLERLATDVQIGKDQLESIKPKQAGRNPTYPETSVEVRLKGVSLEQTTRFLHRIENSESHLIIRSLAVRARRTKEGQVLDVKFSVSSFERA